MPWLIYLIHGSTYDEVRAIFPRSPSGDADANEYKNAHNGNKVEAEIVDGGIIVTPEIPDHPHNVSPEYLYVWTLPATLAILPAAMTSPEAEAFLLAIALQESGCRTRRQERSGPARGFWQFEQNGLIGVLTHPRSKRHIAPLLAELAYPPTSSPYHLHMALEHNDVFACAIARLLIWTVPAPLPKRDNPAGAWQQYIVGWNPGSPRPETWAAFYAQAWAVVQTT